MKVAFEAAPYLPRFLPTYLPAQVATYTWLVKVPTYLLR